MKAGRGLPAVLAVVLALSFAAGIAHADSVLLGSDYLETLPGAFFDFGPGIGPVLLQGRPIGPGTTDTIVQRQEDAILPADVSADTIPIELVALSLESIAPVDVGGSLFDVFVHLTPATTSSGTMVISHTSPDNGTAAPEGTFTSSLTVFFTAEFTPVGPGVPFDVVSSAVLESGPTPWSHEPMLPGTLLVTGPAGDQDANNHSFRPPLFSDFHFDQLDEIKLPPATGRHPAGPAFPGAVPAPPALLLLGAGFAALAVRARGRRAVRSR